MKQNQRMKITDPYLKERVQLSGEQRSGMGWLFWLIVLASLGGGGYYFYPQIEPHVQPVIAQIEQQASALMAETPEPTKVGDNNNESTQETIESVTPSSNNEIVAETPEPVETSQAQQAEIVEAPDESIEESSSEPETIEEQQNSTVATTEQMETVTETVEESTEAQKTPLSEVAVTTALPHETPMGVVKPPQAKSEVESAEQQAQVESLLSQAQVQLRRLRLTKPKGDNAYETYQALQALDEEKANEVLTSIVEWYQQEGQKNLQEGWIAYPTNNNAMLIYERLYKLAPEHEGTKQLMRDILLALKGRVDIHLERDNILEPANDNAYINARLMYQADPKHDITQTALETVEKRMVQIAERQIAQKKFTTPEEDSAYNTYQTMLKMNPDSQLAKKGIETLANRYYELALKRKNQRRESSALILIERGLAVSPEHEKLNRLKQQLEN
jgi:hypothetical protein